MIDWEKFEENFGYYDKETIREVIENYLEEYEERLNTLERNLASGEFAPLSFNAHSLKSVIGNFMAHAPYETCREIETYAKENITHELPTLLKKLKEQIAELNLELREYLQK